MIDNKLIIQTQANGGPPNNQPIYSGGWVVGQNCHIIIDGVGYIVANNPSQGQESMREMGSEQTAPFFGDPVNLIDTASSDLTMLLPIGQNNFTGGIGSLKLETDPNGFELVNNLQLTPQNTLFNGPRITQDTFDTAAPTDSGRWWQEGYFDGVVRSDVPIDYFSIGSNLYYNNNGVWISLATRAPINNLFGYAGIMLVSYGDNGGDLFYPGNVIHPINYNSFGGFRVDGNPFIIYKDGRIYAAFVLPPEAPGGNIQDGPDATYQSWGYSLNYVLPIAGEGLVQTGMGLSTFIDKPPNKEPIIDLPGIPWKGGRILRQLFRTHNNDTTTTYLLADQNILGDIRTQWVDTQTDANLTATWNWDNVNNTAMTMLRGGEILHNMWRADTRPIWLPEWNSIPNTGDRVWKTAIFRDSGGNEAAIIGTTSGLFMWDGVSTTTQTLRPMNYDYFNCFSLAVNHGQVYFTTSRTLVHIWSNTQEAFLNGPWAIQYNQTVDVRLVSSGEYVFIAASGVSKYDGVWRTSIYRYNGAIFDWETYYTGPSNSYPIMGKSISAHDFLWYSNTGDVHINHVTMDPRYSAPQANNVLFRSAMSDCGLPRLRKQVFAVMIRYLQLSPQSSTTLNVASQIGDTIITVAGTASFSVNDWIAIDDSFPNFQEYRQVAAKTATTLTLSHPLTNGALTSVHAVGIGVYKCGAVVTLRNIFTASNPTPRDIQVGGPFRADYLFSYIHLPVPVYTYLDGIQIDYNISTLMELVGWSMLTALNPPYYGLEDLNIRIQDQVKLPNNLFHPMSANDMINALRNAYNKGAVDVTDQFNNLRKMRVQRMSVDYEEPKQRHPGQYQNQATVHIRLLDQDSELFKQESLVLGIPQSQ
jgi:hypothetical protein